MPRWTAVGLGVFCVLLTLGVIVQASRIGSLQHHVEQLQAKVKDIERSRRTEKPADTPTRSEVRALEEKIATVEKKAAEGVEALVNPAPGAGLPTLIKEEDIQQIVDARLEEKLQARGETAASQDAGGDDRKMPLHELAKELELDPQVKAQVAQIADHAKKEIFALLKIPRADGSSIADDVVDAYSSGDAAKVRQVFTRIFSEQIPGTETSYLAGIGEVQQRARENLQGIMGSTLYERYSQMNIKPENIQTGYDPWGEYFQQRNN